ncbi:hypothetical protein ASG68_28130 [Rhizobium sp. Leaf453]|nr:hypothetical protein ASG50_15970 [Rhizobium sp. Leaf386]KQT05125.1 hypothetical protein ASG42_21625 [Rhizobium sp. Leaf391]KQU02110.1 hypothetical protein ASG68_28130 [Rhizobium sp. Leaf453]
MTMRHTRHGSLVRLATGIFVADQRNVVLVGRTGTGKKRYIELFECSINRRYPTRAMSMVVSFL